MGRPSETFKKREKEMKRREKRERKMQRRLEKKAQNKDDLADVPPGDFPDGSKDLP